MRHHRLLTIAMFLCFFISFADPPGKIGWISPSRAFQDDYHEIFQFTLEDTRCDCGEAILELEWSPDGERIASRSYEDVSIWDPTTGELLILIHEAGQKSFSWSPDGAMIATGGAAEGWDMNLPKGIYYEGSEAWIWDSRTGELIHPFVIRYIAEDWPVLHPIVWNPNGTILAAAQADGAMRLWDTRTYEELKGSPPFYVMDGSYWINFLDWSPDGTKLAEAFFIARGGFAGGGIDIWGIDETGLGGSVTLLSLDPYVFDSASEAFIVAWHPDGTRLAGVHWDSVIRIWDVSTGQVLLTVGQDEKWIDIDWNPDGTILASVREDGSVIFWNGETGEMLTEIPIQHVVAFDWNPDGSHFAVGCSDGTIHIWGK